MICDVSRDTLFPPFKTYGSFMDEISSSDILEGLLGNGMFGDKLPPILTSEGFCKYRLSKQGLPKSRWHGWMTYRYSRNTNSFREFGIPNPFAYEMLVRHIALNWDGIRAVLKQCASRQPFKVSRIHLRKRSGTKALFKMNYQNWKADPDPLPKMLIGRKYLVKCDISRCFPSIYTHAVDWAIEGRETAKSNKLKNRTTWASDLDKFAASTRNGETHGLLVGPHASNLLAELILVRVDKALVDKGFRFIRNIDDYECFVDSMEDAELFVVELEKELSEYRLSLNQSKTSISALPQAITSDWVRALKNYPLPDEVSYKDIQLFLDHAIGLMSAAAGNASVLLFALKMLSAKRLRASAETYLMDMGAHLACVYPYLLPNVEDTIIKQTKMPVDSISILSNILYRNAMARRDYLTACYALYYAFTYEFDLSDIDAAGNDVISSDDGLLKLFAFLYSKKRSHKQLRDALKKHARGIVDDEDFDRNWLFVYHALPANELPEGEWREIRKAGIKFITV